MNPYNKDTQEGFFHTWEAGYGAIDQHECPYEGDDEENQQMRLVWMKGYNFKQREGRKERKQSKKRTTKTQEQSIEESTVAQITEEPLAAFSDDVLMLELAKRKQGELTKLKQKRAELDQKIAVLEAICGNL